MSSDHRDTFKRIREIVTETGQHADDVADKLESLKARDPDERTAMLLNTFLDEQRALADKLRRHADNMDSKTAGEFAQFALDVAPDDANEPPAEVPAEAVTQWLLAENARVMGLFQELSRTVASDSVREAVDAMVEMMDSFARKIARESGDTGDI